MSLKKYKKILYKYADALAYKIDIKRRLEKANGHSSSLPQVALSSTEKKEIKQLWGDFGGEYQSFRFYKCFCGHFDAKFVPDDYYDFAEHVLNLRWAAFFLQHKFNLKYIIPASNRAKTIIQRIDGHFVLEDNTEVSKEQAIDILRTYRDCNIIVKNAFGPGGGKGVRKVFMDSEKLGDSAFYEDLFLWNDMVFEEVVKQSVFMSQLNPDSVNTIRFLSLNINEKCTVLSAFIRMGKKGAFVDNLHGGGGVLVGVNHEGYLNNYGIDVHFEKKFEASSGIKLEGLKVPDYDKLKEQIISFHKKIPFANLIGWDIALDENGTPIVIEINLDSALIEAHQIFNGPVFGERLTETMNYIKSRKPLLRHNMITY